MPGTRTCQSSAPCPVRGWRGKMRFVSEEGSHGLQPQRARPLRRQGARPLRGHAQGLRRGPERLGRSRAQARRRALRRARGRDAAGPRGPRRAPPRAWRKPGRARLVRRRTRTAHDHGLQPPRRPARLEGDRAVAHGALPLHEAGRHLLRPRHHRRQGPGAHGASRRARRDGGGGPAEHQVPVGDRGGDRLAQLRRDAQGDRPRREDRRRRRVRHGLGLARAGRRCRRGCAACSGSRSTSRPPRPTSTRVRRAAPPAIRWPSSRSSPPRSSTPGPAA